MQIGHVFLIMALLGLGCIGILLKVADHLKCRGTPITGALFLWAGMLLVTYVLTQQPSLFVRQPGSLYVVAGLCGACASLAIVSFQTGLRHGKIATSWVIINLSTVLPTILSILIYRESVSGAKVAALVLAIAAVLLLWKDKQVDDAAGNAQIKASTMSRDSRATPHNHRAVWLPMMLVCFLTNGLGAFGIRIMSGMGLSEVYRLSYLAGWYCSGFLLPAGVFLARRQFPSGREWALGAALALCSVLGQLGMILALEHGIPGFVVFQVGPGGGLFLVVLVGMVVFRERVSRYGIMGIGLGASALAVLSVG